MFNSKLSPIVAAFALEACAPNHCELKQPEKAEMLSTFEEILEFCSDTEKSVSCIIDGREEKPARGDDILILPCTSFLANSEARETLDFFLSEGTCFDESTVEYDCTSRTYGEPAWIYSY